MHKNYALLAMIKSAEIKKRYDFRGGLASSPWYMRVYFALGTLCPSSLVVKVYLSPALQALASSQIS